MEPVTIYCTVAQLESIGMRAEALAKLPTLAKQQAVEVASRLIDGFLGAFTLPLMAIGTDLTRAAAIIAAYDLLSAKGLNPDNSASDANVVDRYKDTMKWLLLVAQGTVTPSGIIDSSPGAEAGESASARVISDPSRGFSTRGSPFGTTYRGPFQS